MIPGLTVVKKPLETYLIVRESDGDRELTAAECQELYDAMAERDRLRKELERAYRAISGFYTTTARGRLLDKTTLAYHSPTIGAAMRFIREQSLDGAEYFTGKHVSVLHKALELETAS